MHYISLMPKMIGWWYSGGVSDLIAFLKALYLNLTNFFSIKVIISTFLEPWKKMVQARRPGIDGFKDWVLDNMVSRGVGITMRLFLIGLFLIGNVIYAFFCVAAFIFWFGLPAVILFSFSYLFWGYKPW